MRCTIKFEEGSLDDFHEAIEHYEKISDELGDKFHNEFWDKIDHVKENPIHHQLRYKIVRIAHLKVFPYGIHFILDGTVIRVFKILHHKQYFK